MSRLNKSTTQLLIKGPEPCCAPPDWGHHPSWIAGLEGLNAYNSWVCDVVMPIVFQWIDENKDAVYESVSKENADDIGVVIASAFEIVKTKENYERGLAKAKEFEEARENGKVKLETINPVWTNITEKVREGTRRVFDEKKDVLKGTIC